MIQENEIRAKLLSLSDLNEFEDWVVEQSWNMHRDSEPNAQKLVGKIELALAEFHAGHMRESVVRQMLRNLARTYEVSFNPSDNEAESISYSSSSNSLAQIQPVEMQVSAVFVS
jgi:hypothetical protein